MPALIPMQRSGSRATFPSRDPTFAGARASSLRLKMLSPFEPTRRRNRPEALSTCVRPYERTSLPAWRQEPTNWCHGYPAGHAWSLLPPGRPPSSPDGRRWPNPTFRPLMATFLMLLRSRGAIGRVRATPGPLPTARTAQTPGKGLTGNRMVTSVLTHSAVFRSEFIFENGSTKVTWGS